MTSDEAGAAVIDPEHAAAIVADPDADPATLAQIAYLLPAYRPAIAAHPRAYPGLVGWIAAAGIQPPGLLQTQAVGVDAYGRPTAYQHADHPYIVRSPADRARNRLITARVLVGVAVAVDLASALVFRELFGYWGSRVSMVGVIVILAIAVLVLPTSGLRRLIGVGIVAIVAVVQVVVMSGSPNYTLADLSWNPQQTTSTAVTCGLVVLAWLICRQRPPASYLVAPLVAIAVGVLHLLTPWIEGSWFSVPWEIPVLITHLIDWVIPIGGCFLAAAPIFRGRGAAETSEASEVPA